MKRDYGTATSEGISDGFKKASDIAQIIKAIPNPAVRNLIKGLIALIRVE